MAERDAKGRFVKGHTGKGPGRKSLPKEFKQACEKNSLDALRVVIEIMKDPNQPASVRLKACEMIMDRAFGKAPQAIQIDERDTTIRIIEDNPESADWNG